MIGIGGGTVAAAFRKRGLPAVCWSTLMHTAHQPNEHSSVHRPPSPTHGSLPISSLKRQA
jgi:hypothetical protein